MSIIDRGKVQIEEIANSISHGVGFIAALVGVPILIYWSFQEDRTTAVIGAFIFGISTLVLYLTSAVYHALPHGRAKNVFRLLDHAAIFVMIAGTYTPFAVGALWGPWGWSLLTIIWVLAIAGIVLDSNKWWGHPKLSTLMYLVMGWLIVLAIWPLYLALPVPGLVWLIGGGLFYTVGVAFYVNHRIRFSHFIWHLFVLAGTTCHYFAVIWYAGGKDGM